MNNNTKKLVRLVVDSLMILMLFGLVALPASSVGLLNYKNQNAQVLSVQDYQPVKSSPDVITPQEIVETSETTQTTQTLAN